MNFFFMAMVTVIGLQFLRFRDQRRRIALLAAHLSPYQIEKLMETLTQGYLRALGESDLQRREQVWQVLITAEEQLAAQAQAFASGFAKLPEIDTRVSKFAIALPFADRLFPRATFDVRQAFALHAQGFQQTLANAAQRSARDKAFTLSAELFLLQHTCHWFCRSRNMASARLALRHQTPYSQLLASVSPETRSAYRALTGV